MTATATKDRPILMSGPMVRAILDGRKSQTRRVVKPQPPGDIEEAFAWFAGELRGDPNGCAEDGLYVRTLAGLTYRGPCPYGAPSDVLWVREGLRYTDSGRWIYRADDSLVLIEDGDQTAAAVWDHHKDSDFCASIHMPYWACRLFLRVKSVRVERVQEISAADADAEGYPQGTEPMCMATMGRDRLAWYRELWDSLNASRGCGWVANPWVWVIEFERTEKPSRLRGEGE